MEKFLQLYVNLRQLIWIMRLFKLFFLLAVIGAPSRANTSAIDPFAAPEAQASERQRLDYLNIDLDTVIPGFSEQTYHQQKRAIADYFANAGHDISKNPENRIRFDGPVVELYLTRELHRLLQNNLPPMPQLEIGGYLYLKARSKQEGAPEKHIRYYAKLPKIPSSETKQLELKFHLEPNVSQELHQDVAPMLPTSFIEEIQFTPYFSIDDGVGIQLTITDSPAFDIVTEFNALPQELVEFATCHATGEGSSRTMSWHYRPQVWGIDHLMEYQQQRISRAFEANAAYSDIESILIQFFKSCDIDFANNAGSRLIWLFNSNSLVAQLPERDMEKLRSLFSKFTLRQMRLTGSFKCALDSKQDAFRMSVLTLSGKRAELRLQESDFFDLNPDNGTGASSISLKLTPNIESLGQIYALTEWAIQNYSGYHQVKMSGEVAVNSPELLQQAKLLIDHAGNTEEWAFSFSALHMAFESAKARDGYYVDFIPISRSSVIEIMHAVPRDPFNASPTQEDLSIIAYLENKGIPFQDKIEATLEYDGEQLIVTHTEHYLDMIISEIMKLEFDAPVVSQMTFKYVDQSGSENEIFSEFTGISGKAASIELFQRPHDSDGENAPPEPVLSVRTTPDAIREYNDIAGIRGNTEINLLAEDSQQEWYHDIDWIADNYIMQQQLPAKAKIKWKFFLRDPD